MRGRGGGRSGLLFLLAAMPGRASSGTEPDVPSVGVEFSVLELWSLEKLFLPHLFLLPSHGTNTLPLSTILYSQLSAWEGNLGVQ